MEQLKEQIKAVRQLIKQNNINELKDYLIDKPELINAETPFGTWLEVAASKGDLDIVQFFIDKGIDVNKCCGMTNGGPLATASFNGHLDIVKLLLQNGAIIDVSSSEKNPLFSAIYNGHFEVVKCLVESGIDLKASYEMGSLKNVDAIEYARQYGRTEIVNYLKDI